MSVYYTDGFIAPNPNGFKSLVNKHQMTKQTKQAKLYLHRVALNSYYGFRLAKSPKIPNKNITRKSKGIRNLNDEGKQSRKQITKTFYNCVTS